MIRASTPTHRFRLPIDPELVDKFRLVYSQCGEKKLVKNKEDMSLVDGWWTVKLTQEEANKFTGCTLVKIQIRVKTTGGDVIPSKEMHVTVQDVLDDEVL